MKTRVCIRCHKVFETELRYKKICDMCTKPRYGNGEKHSQWLHNRIYKHRKHLRRGLNLK